MYENEEKKKRLHCFVEQSRDVSDLIDLLQQEQHQFARNFTYIIKIYPLFSNHALCG